jgi:acyl carrier protein
MTVPTPQQLLPIVRQYIEKTRGSAANNVDENTRLLGEGLLDSFALVGLIAELSTALRVELAPGDLIPEDFETVTTLRARLVELLE